MKTFDKAAKSSHGNLQPMQTAHRDPLNVVISHMDDFQR